MRTRVREYRSDQEHLRHIKIKNAMFNLKQRVKEIGNIIFTTIVLGGILYGVLLGIEQSLKHII